MEYSNAKLRANNKLVTMLYCVYVFFSMLSSTQINKIPYWGAGVKLISIALIAFLYFLFFIGARVKAKLLPVIIVVGGFFIVSAWNSNSGFSVALLLAFFLGGKFITTDHFLKYYVRIGTGIIIITLLLYFIGVYEYDALVSRGSVTRLYLGFSYTTRLPNFFFHILLVYTALKKRSINIIETTVILALNAVIMYWTSTRAVYYEVIFLCVILWLQRAANGFFGGRVFKFVMTWSMPALAVLAIYLAYSYSPTNSAYIALDSILSGRLYLGYKAINRVGFSLLGNTIAWITGRQGIERTEDYFYVDSSYLNIALSAGFVVLVLVILGFTVLNRKAFKEGKTMLCISLLLIAIHSFSDPQLIDLTYNPFLIFVGTAILTKRELPVASLSRPIEKKARWKIILPSHSFSFKRRNTRV